MPSDAVLDGKNSGPAIGQAKSALSDFLPESVCQRLDGEQIGEIERAARDWMRASGRQLPVDIRVSLPGPFRGFFLNVMAGSERRSKSRRRTERQRRRLATAGNVIFTACLVGVMYSGLVIGALAFSGIVE